MFGRKKQDQSKFFADPRKLEQLPRQVRKVVLIFDRVDEAKSTYYSSCADIGRQLIPT
jgi:hypothetical protein